MIRKWLGTAAIVAAIQITAALPLFGSSAFAFDPNTPFVICDHQRYALCAEADCFVYDGVAYCKCEVKRGDSISLQLSYSTPAGDRNVCQVNRQGVANGYMVSTYSLPSDAVKGGNAAAYTCPGTDNQGSGVPAPVAYGQCDGGICFTSSRGQRFPGFDAHLRAREVMCSCPVTTNADAGSSDSLGYQIFGPYNPSAPVGSRCDANTCASCAVANPTANGAAIKVGAPTGAGDFLTAKLTGAPAPALNECLCSCTTTNNVTTCTSVTDMTQ